MDYQKFLRSNFDQRLILNFLVCKITSYFDLNGNLSVWVTGRFRFNLSLETSYELLVSKGLQAFDIELYRITNFRM